MNFCEVADYSQRSGCVIDGDITAGYHGKMEPWHDFIFLFICLCLFFQAGNPTANESPKINGFHYPAESHEQNSGKNYNN